jgi:lysophospholipase L1-like esterase
MLVLYVLSIIVVVILLIYWTLRRKVLNHLPKRFPQLGHTDHPDAGGRQIVLCAGDSITHGNVGANYVEMLENWLPSDQYYFINAGRNADLTYTLINRLDSIIACQPDILTLLIGTNDINASMLETRRKEYEKLNKITVGTYPNFESFKQNYSLIIKRLKTETKAKIAIASIPIMSEDLQHPVNKRADEYSDFIKQIAEREQVTYLPVREQMKDYIENHPKKLKYSYEQTYKIMNICVLKHYLFGQSWDEICAANGNDLTQDNLHFNTRGATMIGLLVKKFILES